MLASDRGEFLVTGCNVVVPRGGLQREFMRPAMSWIKVSTYLIIVTEFNILRSAL